MVTIAANALYTTLRRRGTTRQLATAIVTCVACALLLLPAVLWYNLRFVIHQASLSATEVEMMLVYIGLFGWVVPMGTTASYYLFTAPRISTASLHIPSQKRSTRANDVGPQPPRHVPGVPAPFVYGEDSPWGWLEYRMGRFQGQRLALTRSIVTLGRDENNDIWLDDEMASRHHAEIAWDKGQVFVTDCDSLNGVLVSRRRIHGSVTIEPNELLEIGSHRFVFIRSEAKRVAPVEQDDPLANHVWRSSLERLTAGSDLLPATRLLAEDNAPSDSGRDRAASSSVMHEFQVTAQVGTVQPSSFTSEASGAITIQNGEMVGQSFMLDRPMITVGRGSECDIVIDDASISRRHVQILRQANGDYVLDLSSRNGTKVNDELLVGPRLLAVGDTISVGNISMQYCSVQMARTVPLSFIVKPRPFVQSGPMPLRLPSKENNDS